MRSLKILYILLATLTLVACSANSSSQSKDKASLKLQLQQQWQLVSIDNLAIKGDIKSTLDIDSEGKATGNLACNNFFGTLEVQEQSMRVHPMGSTRKMCLQLINDVEQRVMQVLAQWSTIQISNDMLTLQGAEHQLVYKKY